MASRISPEKIKQIATRILSSSLKAEGGLAAVGPWTKLTNAEKATLIPRQFCFFDREAQFDSDGKDRFLPDYTDPELGLQLVGFDTSSMDSEAVRVMNRMTERVGDQIQAYIAMLGWGGRRRRLGGAGKNCDEEVPAYEVGFGSVAVCGKIPIPSSSIDGDGRRYLTGSSGSMEIAYYGEDEILRPAQTLEEMNNPPVVVEKPCVKKRGMVLCNSWKCLPCSVRRSAINAAKIQTVTAKGLFKGASYAFGTITPRHFHKDLPRMLPFLRTVFRAFASCDEMKDLQKKYGFIILFKALEITMDDINASYKSGAHPHFHFLILFLRKHSWGKKGVKIYDVPTEADLAAIQNDMAAAWYKYCARYFKETENRDIKRFQNNIEQFGVKLMLYPVSSVAPNDPEEFDKWKVEKEKFEKSVEETRKKWEKGTYALPEQIKRYVPRINEVWADHKEHFYKQLAGIGAIAAYTGVQSAFDVCKEIAGGAIKTQNGRSSRISLLAWIYQASKVNNPKLDREVRDAIRAVFRVNFFTASKSFRQMLKSDFVMYKDGEFCVPDDLTRGELRCRFEAEKTALIPRILTGDRLLIDRFSLQDDDFKVLHGFGSNRAIAAVNDLLEKRGKRNVIGFEEAKKAFSDVFSAIEESGEKVSYGRFGVPIVPKFIEKSDCWQENITALVKKYGYRYQNILKLVAKYRRWEIPDLIGEVSYKEAVSDFSADIRDRVEKAWSSGLKKRVLESAYCDFILYPDRKEIEWEQKREEQAAITYFLQKNGFADEIVDIYSERSFDQSLFDDFYGSYQVWEIGKNWRMDYILKNPDFSVGDHGIISYASLKFGADWRLPPPVSVVDGLETIEGWWSDGGSVSPLVFRPEASDWAAMLMENFDFSDTGNFFGLRVGRCFPVAKGHGKFEGKVLVYVEGKLTRLAREKREAEQKAIREVREVALADFFKLAVECGFTRSELRRSQSCASKELVRIFDIFYDFKLDSDFMREVLSHHRYANGKGHVRKRDRLASKFELVFSDFASLKPLSREEAIDWLTPCFSVNSEVLITADGYVWPSKKVRVPSTVQRNLLVA